MSVFPNSLSPVHFPQHTFTSTLMNHKTHHSAGFNVWIVLLTAIFFFTVLAWFNFVLAFYATVTTTDPNHKDQTMSTLGFAILWTLIAILMYYVMESFGMIQGSEGSDGSEHPLLRNEGRSDVSNVSDLTNINIPDYVGEVDIPFV